MYRSLGGGAFAPPITLLAPASRTRMAIGDVTGDGRPDLVTVNNFSPPAVEVYRQLPDGSFGAGERTAFDANPDEITIGDLNGDGRLDVAATYTVGIQVVGVRLLLQTVAGTLAPGPTVQAYAAQPLRTGDVDGDGRTDLVVMYGTRVGVRLQQAGGVPDSGVSAVVLNVTVTEPTAGGFLTAWPSGAGRPLASNLNYVAGQTVPNLVAVKVGAGGKVDLFNYAGAAHVGVDVAGWYGEAGSPVGGLLTPVTPSPLLDTRAGAKVGPDGTLGLQVTGRGGVPASGVSAVVLNVTATEPTATGFLTAWPAGPPRPLASNLNFSAGQTVPYLVMVKVGAGGVVNLFNFSGSTHVIADVAGWYA